MTKTRDILFEGQAQLSALGAIGERLINPIYGYDPKEMVQVRVWRGTADEPSERCYSRKESNHAPYMACDNCGVSITEHVGLGMPCPPVKSEPVYSVSESWFCTHCDECFLTRELRDQHEAICTAERTSPVP